MALTVQPVFWSGFGLLLKLNALSFSIAGKISGIAAPTGTVKTLTPEVGGLTTEVEILTGTFEALSPEVENVTRAVGGLTFALETLTFEVGALIFDVSGRKSTSNYLIFRYLCMDP